MTPKDHFLEGTFWDKFWRPIRYRALLFTPEISSEIFPSDFCRSLFLKICSGGTSAEQALFSQVRNILRKMLLNVLQFTSCRPKKFLKHCRQISHPELPAKGRKTHQRSSAAWAGTKN